VNGRKRVKARLLQGFCIACQRFGFRPADPAMDPTGTSPDERDRLCMLHRARAGEGSCVLCGLRLPWVSPWPRSPMGCCELCYRVLYGNAAGDYVQAKRGRLGRRRAS
jgi:hypothetical protein